MPRLTKRKKHRFTKKRGGNDDSDISESEDEGFYTPAGTPPRSRSSSISSVSSSGSFRSAFGDEILFLPEEINQALPGEVLPSDIIEDLGPAVQNEQAADATVQSHSAEPPGEAAEAQSHEIEYNPGPVRPIRVTTLESVRSQPRKNIDFGKGLVTYFNFKGKRDFAEIRDIVQKIYFFAIQEHLLKGLLGLTYLGLSKDQSIRFLTVFEGSFFLRLQTGFSFNTSDFDVKVYPLDGNTIESYSELLERILPVREYISQLNAVIQFPMYDHRRNPIIDRYGNQHTIKTTNLGNYVHQTILGLIIPAITDFASKQNHKDAAKSNELLQLLGELSISILNSEPILDISQPPNPTSPLKVVVIQSPSERPQYYAMADIAITKVGDESIVPKVNELVARNPDEAILKSVKGFKLGSLYDQPVDLRADPISSNYSDYIPQVVAYQVFEQVFYVPAPLYYYYEKKLLYCDIVDDRNMCKNKETWTDLGYPFGGRNIIKESHEYFENKFKKSMKAMTYGNIPPRYQGGKRKIKAKRKTKRIQRKKRLTKRKI